MNGLEQKVAERTAELERALVAARRPTGQERVPGEDEP